MDAEVPDVPRGPRSDRRAVAAGSRTTTSLTARPSRARIRASQRGKRHGKSEKSEEAGTEEGRAEGGPQGGAQGGASGCSGAHREARAGEVEGAEPAAADREPGVQGRGRRDR